MKTFISSTILCSALSMLATNAQASCGSAFCSIDTHSISENSENHSHSSLDVRYEYIDQNQVRTKEKEISVGQISHHHDEVRTLNQNLLVQYNRKVNEDWVASVMVPISSRTHHHIHNHVGARG